jgi:predicted nucleic acid-binding Zn ribbon protein
MPKYVYQGLQTNQHYEFEQRFNEPAYTHHPETGEPLKRLISAPAVIFKGSGWYSKDSKSSGKSESKPESKPEAKAEGAEATGESKPEAKAETKTESKSESKPAKVESPAD